MVHALNRIFWLSFLLLFSEILALRWLGIEIPVVRSFPNLVIMVCLVAASAGISKAAAKSLSTNLNVAITCSACVLLLTPLIFATQLGLPSLSLKFGGADDASSISRALMVLIVSITSLYAIFHLIGKWLGKEFEGAPPLAAYSYNLLGSIAGTVAFGVISWLGVPPWVWILTAGAVTFVLYKKPVVPLLTILLAGGAFATTSHSLWSPYSKLDVVPIFQAESRVVGPNNYILNSNNDYFHLGLQVLTPQQVKDLQDEAKARKDMAGLKLPAISWLIMPFQSTPYHDRVLVLGSGSGTDVAYALAHGVKRITAIEIDPIICKLGRERHPDKPYLDPRVELHNEDARTFLRYSKDKFDLVEFAFLDPGSTINSASFLRVDNYVYTVESIRAAIKLCDTNGIVAVYETIRQANGGVPPIGFTNKEMQSCYFVFGPGIANFKETNLTGADLVPYKPTGEIRPCTDQWPFFYLTYDASGIWLYVMVLIVAVVLPALLLLRGGGTGISGAEWANMFFLGQAFMLMETKSITHLSLLLGATWIVSSAVIMTVLLFAYAANLLVSKKLAPPLYVLYACLAASLLVQVLVQIPESSSMSAATITLIYCFIDCFPILFGSMIFSTCFGKTKFSTQALSANLLGVSIGGLTENLCIVTGTPNLTYIAMLLYGMSFLAVLRRGKDFAATDKTAS
jgi:Spermine/spermidine synthase domain